MVLDGVHRYSVTPAENRFADVYSLSTNTSLSSDSSCSNHPNNRSTEPRDTYNNIAPQDVIETLNLLEVTEQEVSYEVARIEDEIKEARVMVEEYRRERRARIKENAELIKEEERQSIGVDDDLWLTV